MRARDNRLILGDNAVVLPKLRRSLGGKVRLAYLDPPFNTGRKFGEYDDRETPEKWADRMRVAAEAIAPLLSDDGAMAVEIDDTELGSLITLLDAVFGRAQRMSVITIVRSAATGHKAINRGPVNVADYLLVYAKDRTRFRPNALHRAREGTDPAYATYLENPEAPFERWTFSPLRRRVASALGFGTTSAARRSIGSDAFEREVTRFSLAHPAHVVRFAQVRYEAVGRAVQALVDRSKADPERVMHLARAGQKQLLVRGGNRILFLADKVRVDGGVPRVTEALTNVWDDIGFQGIAKEGGVRFVRNKKPERLLERVVAMLTGPGDLVLDPFAGSGTTLAVAHKMGRSWVGVEREPELYRACEARLGRVVSGEDDTGISARVGWKGGGSFRTRTGP